MIGDVQAHGGIAILAACGRIVLIQQLQQFGRPCAADIIDARVTDYEPLIDGLLLPDPNDRHLLAGAIHGGEAVRR